MRKFQKGKNRGVRRSQNYSVGKHSILELNNLDDDVLSDKQPEETLIKRNLVEDSHPEPDRRWGEYGNFRLVGHGKITNPNTCGIHTTTRGCLHVEKHNITTLDGNNHAGKMYFRRHPLYCYKSSCPVCYKHGWAIREAGRIEHRIKEASKNFGLAEHIVLSVPVRDYHLSFTTLRRKAVEVANKRGIIGGCLIFHGFRYRPHKGWYWSPHFHCIGFVLGGYVRCRNCERKSNCDPCCNGFDSRAWKLFNKDGWYVKVLGRRKTVFGTAWYQLHHSTYDSSVRNFHIATWFGVCSYRKLKVTPEVRKELCPICQSELVEVRYTGSDYEQFLGKRDGFADLVENGVVVWSEKPHRRRKGIAVARLQESSITNQEFDLWMAYTNDKIDKKLPKQVFTCFLCNQQILNINGMRMLDGRRPVHTHCLEKLQDGIREVAH
jgi:hypothetical protein